MIHLAFHQLAGGSLRAIDGFGPDMAENPDATHRCGHDVGEGDAGAVEHIEPGVDSGRVREQLGVLPNPRIAFVPEQPGDLWPPVLIGSANRDGLDAFAGFQGDVAERFDHGSGFGFAW